MNKDWVGKFLLVLAMAWLLACTEKGAGRGGADETSNGIMACVVDSLGKPISSALVFLRPADFAANQSLALSQPGAGVHNAMTDSHGIFKLDSLAYGNYVLEVRTESSGVKVDFAYSVAQLSQDLVSDTLALSKLGSVKGCVQLPPGVAFARVLVLGLEYWTFTDASGCFELATLPAGELTLVALMPNESTIIGQAQATILSGDSVHVDTLPPPQSSLSQWEHGATLVVNTRASGVLLSEALHNYPLMVRLVGDSFPQGASASGADLRVTDTLGTPIPFVLSYWDALAQEATLWVLLDSLPANDSAAVAHLHWGRTGSLPADRPDQVFDTLSKWALMLPLQATFRDTFGALRTPDLSGYAHHGEVIGTSKNMPEFSRQGTWFDGIEQAVGVGHFPLNFGDEDYTVETWLRPEANAGIWLSRDNKSEGNWNHAERAFYLGNPGASVTALEGLNPTLITHGTPNNTYCAADQPLALNQWVHLAIRRSEYAGDTAQVQWFIDGVAAPMLNTKVVDRSDDLNDTLYVAGRMFERSYQGWITQMQISRTARSPAWIQFNATIQRDQANQAVRIFDIY